MSRHRPRPRPSFRDYIRASPAVHLPLVERGVWRIDRTVVSERKAQYLELRAAIGGGGGLGRGRVRAGEAITMLYRDRALVMSDTPDELRDFYQFWRRARGHVLVNGLGLGCAVRALLIWPQVERVTVVEIDDDLLAMMRPLLGPQVARGRVNLIHDDALTVRWPVGQRFDSAWHDVWDDICGDNWPEIRRLHRRYGGRVDHQESWSRAELEVLR